MIHLVDQMLEQFLRADVPLSRGVDVSFATPDKRWGATVTNPTVNLFLWDIRPDLERAAIGRVQRVAADGSQVLTRPDPTVKFRYLVTAWAGEHRDEHQLLGAVLRTLLKTDVIGPDHVPDVFVDTGEIGIELAPGGDPGNKDFWSSLDGQLKPGLDVILTMEIPIWLEIPEGPGITGIELTVDLEPDGIQPPPEPAAEGRDVLVTRTRRGRTVVTTATEGKSPG
ncbi:MAG: DUF4255 domain-containing protein [Acidimicrobiales bacterium]